MHLIRKLCFPCNNYYTAKSFSHSTTMMNNFTEQLNNLHIGTVMIEISKINFDYYKRSYPRIQTLLTEIMSVISLAFAVFSFLTEFY